MICSIHSTPTRRGFSPWARNSEWIPSPSFTPEYAISYTKIPIEMWELISYLSRFRTYERAAGFFKHLKTLKITTNEMYTDVEKRAVTMLCTSDGQLEAGPYATDYVFVLTMTEDGKRIQKLSEWPDFHKVQEVLKKTFQSSIANGPLP